MGKWNHHFANHFGSCMLLAKARDEHRNRDVEVRMLPGEFEVVGVTDGTDAWIAPVIADPFNVNIRGINSNSIAAASDAIGFPAGHVDDWVNFVDSSVCGQAVAPNNTRLIPLNGRGL